MKFLYNIAIYLYIFAIRIASIKNPKAKQWLRGRKKYFTEIQKIFTDKSEKWIWIHAASLGEFEQGRILIEQIKIKLTDYKILLTFFSPSGYQIRKNYQFADEILYFPADTPQNAHKIVNSVNPQIAIFIKYEFWYNHFFELNKNKIPIIMVSSIFKPKHIFFKFYGGLHRKILSFVEHFFVQNEESVKLLESINLNNVSIIPDTRIDRVFQISKNVKSFDKIDVFCGSEKILIAGSSYQTEEEFISKLLKNKIFKGKIIIAPHQINRENLKRIKKLYGEKAIFYTQMDHNKKYKEQILILDTIGMLSSIYQYGNYCIIGGGFGKSIHNILEPATFGLPIMFGQSAYHKFQEALDLVELGGAFIIKNYNDFENCLNKMQKDEKIGLICKEYIKNNIGGSEKVLNYVEDLLYSL